jgi:hypothetical protein
MVCSLTGAVLTSAGLTYAQGNEPWKIDGKLLGQPKDLGGLDAKQSEDVSGIACATTAGFPRICLVADDETQGTQVVILKDGELVAGDFIRLIDDVHADKPLELDAEGVAYADGSFYVIGSHGRPRHEADAAKEAKNKAKAAASRRVFRIRFAPDAVDLKNGKLAATPDIKASSELSRLIKAQTELAPWFDKALDVNGLTIEGVAAQDGFINVGLRGPVLDDGSAAILSAPLVAVFNGQAEETKLHRVGLGKDTLGKPRGIRDLVAYGDGYLLLAGPVSDPPLGHDIKLGDYAVFWWKGRNATKLLDLKGYGKTVKPEALLPLDEENGKLRALLFFDGPKEGAPRPIEIDLR